MTTIANAEFISKGDISVVPAPTCPLCGGQGAVLYEAMTDWLWGVPGEWRLRHCMCGLAWLDPQPSPQDIPKLYASYYTHSGVEHRRLEGLRREITKCILARMGYRIPPSQNWLARLVSHVPSIARARALEVFDLPASQIGTLLDVGCGNGQFIRQMRSLGWDVCGVDPDPTAVAYGLNQGIKVLQGTIADVPVYPRYDVITLNHVIEHVPDPIALLMECKKRLTPRTGRILITTPNLNSLGHHWFGRYWRGLEIPRHLLMFSIPALKSCVSQAGLTVNFVTTESRLARMIYTPSAYAKTGETQVGNKTNFRPATKAAAFLFQGIEELTILFRKDAGEELFCVCNAPVA